MIPRRQVPVSIADVLAWSGALLERDGSSVGRVREFESAFARYIGCPYAHATASGRNAIVLALQACGARPGDEILVPAITLGELLPILRGVGFRPVAVDVDADTFNVDVRHLVRHMGPRTGAVLATHLLGGPCDIEAICSAARDRGIAVVEDCAHALGATVGDRAAFVAACVDGTAVISTGEQASFEHLSIREGEIAKLLQTVDAEDPASPTVTCECIEYRKTPEGWRLGGFEAKVLQKAEKPKIGLELFEKQPAVEASRSVD